MKTNLFASALRRTTAGSTLLTALGVMTVLASVAGVMIPRITNHYRATYHSTSWEEAFRAAECGAELAIASINANPDPVGGSFPGPDWTETSDGGWTRTYHASSTPVALPAHAGDGNTKLFATVTLTPSMAAATATTPAEVKKGWYTLRSKGTAEIPGSKSVTEEASLRTLSGKKNHKSHLRKLNFTNDATGGVLKLPQTSRTVQLVVQPDYNVLGTNAMTTNGPINLTGGAMIDSYDSSNILKSTNGRYDPSKSQKNADIATNADGSLSNLNGNTVKGDAMSNRGTILGTSGVTGQVANNFKTSFAAVPTPNWPMYTDNNTLTSHSTTELAASIDPEVPVRIKSTSIDLGSQADVKVTNPDPTKPAYIDIWVTGDMSISAQAKFTLGTNVFLRIYVEGNVNIGAGSFTNGSGKAANLQIYGVDPVVLPVTNPKQYEDRVFNISGQGDFTGVVYAPYYAFDFTGGGHFYGSIVAKKAKMTGNTGFHFDEALGAISNGVVNGYLVKTWMEDIR